MFWIQCEKLRATHDSTLHLSFPNYNQFIYKILTLTSTWNKLLTSASRDYCWEKSLMVTCKEYFSIRNSKCFPFIESINHLLVQIYKEIFFSFFHSLHIEPALESLINLPFTLAPKKKKLQQRHICTVWLQLLIKVTHQSSTSIVSYISCILESLFHYSFLKKR